MLGVPESTLRRWALLFRSHLSDQKGRKQRSYVERDIYIFGQVKDLSSQNIPLGEIGSRLVVTGDTGQQETPGSALALVPSIAARFEQLETDNRAALDQIDQLKRQVEQLASQLNTILTKKKPWYKRLFD